MVSVLVEAVHDDAVEGRAEHQGPDVDGSTMINGVDARVGDIVPAVVTGNDGADLLARAVQG
jgi:hypothetical protein